MGKRQKVKVGDVLEIPLNYNLTGYARVLHKDIDELMLECFDLKQEEIILSRRCWNDYVKNGKWKVVDFKEVSSDYNYPVFYGQNALTDEYYKIKGEDILKGIDFEIDARIKIDEKETIGMEYNSIYPPEVLIEEYLERLNGGCN